MKKTKNMAQRKVKRTKKIAPHTHCWTVEMEYEPNELCYCGNFPCTCGSHYVQAHCMVCGEILYSSEIEGMLNAYERNERY